MALGCLALSWHRAQEGMGNECAVACTMGGLKQRRCEIRFVRAQPDALTDSGAHAVADSWPYVIAHCEPNASTDPRPDAGAHYEVR
jgi:hypothetical protein